MKSRLFDRLKLRDSNGATQEFVIPYATIWHDGPLPDTLTEATLEGSDARNLDTVVRQSCAHAQKYGARDRQLGVPPFQPVVRAQHSSAGDVQSYHIRIFLDRGLREFLMPLATFDPARDGELEGEDLAQQATNCAAMIESALVYCHASDVLLYPSGGVSSQSEA